MKRNRRKSGKNARNHAKQSRSLSYDPLEPRKLLAVDTGLDLIGASLVDPDVNSVLPNAEGDVSTNHFVEIGEQTFTVYDRNNAIVEATTLNQFFVDAGGELFGEDLNAPRIVFDQLSQRWFAVATGDGNGAFDAGNWLHIAFSDTSDPTGQWQQVQFVPDITGTNLHTNATLGVDADGIYVATQNFDKITGDIEDVSIYSFPKSDLFLPNPTIANITRFDNLDILTFGQSIQFASNFDASDGQIHAFSTPMIQSLGAGFEEAPDSINVFQISDADTPDAVLSVPTQILLGAFEAPLPIEQPANNGNGQPTVNLTPGVGLTSSLREVNGSIFGAQTVHIVFTEGGADFRTNAINWFQLDAAPGQTPSLTMSPLRGPVSRVIVDTDDAADLLGNNLPDEPEFDMDPAIETLEFGRVTYFNPSIAVNETGLVALTFNGTTQRDGVQFGAVNTGNFGTSDPQDNNDAFRVSTFASVGLSVNGARTGGTDANPIFGRNAIQLEAPVLLRQSAAVDPFTTSGPFNVWGQYSSLSPDPANPNAFFSVIPFQDEASNEEWGVHVAELLPVHLRPVIEATGQADEIIVSLDPADTGFIQIEINGVITDRFDRSIIGQIVIAGHDGSDTIIIDHTNGDPTPAGIPAGFNGTLPDSRGFVIHGGDGTDVIEIRSAEDVDFVVDTLTNTGLFYPGYLVPFLGMSDPAGLGDGGAQDGTFTAVTQNGEDLLPENQITNAWVDIETIVGGSGDDTFEFTTGPLAGNAEGRDGDDVFIFTGGAVTDGSVNGGAGFNTLDLSQRASETEIELFSVGQNMGFNGRTVDGPIGQFDAVLDQFRDISLIIGSEGSPDDSLQALNQAEATYTIVSTTIDNIRIPNNSDPFIASSLMQSNATVFFTNFEELRGSVLNDVFNVQSTDIDGNEDLLLDGRAGDDVFNFSSDAPLNTGTTAGIGGLIFVEGGGGENSLTVSEESNPSGTNILVLGARISGPVEIVYQDAFDGNFDVTIIGSDSGDDTFTLQSFLPTNTLSVFGRNGNDIFIIQDLSQAEVELFGGEGDDEYIIEQVNGIDDRNVLISDSIDAENDRAIIAGTILDEIFIVDIDSFESDQFIFIGVEEFGFDGRGGDDEFYVRGISEDFPVLLRGGDGNDIFHISSDAPANLGDLTNLNNNLTIDGGTGINQIIISNESGGPLDVEISTSEITGLFNGTLTYSSTDGVFGLVDDDGNLDDENFGGIDITGSNGGNDRFTITGFLAQHSLVIDGRLGDDEFIIGDGMGAGIDGVVVVDGASDSDTYTILLDDISANVMLLDSGFSGNDTLNALGSDADETIRLSEFNISTDTQTVQINNFIEEIIIDGMGGDDTLVLLNAPAPLVTLDGNDGDDTIRVNGTVGVADLTVDGGAGNDTINLNESSFLTDIEAFGSEGNDTMTVSDSVVGDVSLDGGTGDDSYNVTYVGGGSRAVQIIDGNPVEENNSATISGTSSTDEFFVDSTNVVLGAESVVFGNSIDALAINGFAGGDIFNVPAITIGLELNGNTGDDIFNLASDAPALTGNVNAILADVNISGGLGINRLNIVDETGAANNVTITSNAITGLTNSVITYAGRFDRTDGEIGGVHIIGSNTGNDTFDIVSFSGQNSLRIDGLNGQDTFNIGNGVAGSALFDGGDDSDIYNFEFGAAAARNITIEDSGVMGVDTLNLIGSANDDNIIISTGGISDGISTLSFNVPLNEIEIMGLGGNDSFVINGSQVANVKLHGNDGNDTFTVNSTAGINNLDLFGDVGDDSFNFFGSSDPTRIDALGSIGNDSFLVGRNGGGRLFLDGQDGSDSYQVNLLGEGNRRIDTRDTGDFGNDVTTVLGTSDADRIAIRTTRFLYDNEVVIFDENTERVRLSSDTGNDRIVVFGSRSPLTEVFAGEGNDNFVINGGSRADTINLNGDNGNDTFLVRKTTVDTTTNLFGNAGNDRFNIGSTVGQDDGNLGLIRGDLNIAGGVNDDDGEDQLIANDNGVNAAYSYRVAPLSIQPIAGPANLPRANFAGINYNSSIEYVRLDGTAQANLFEVVASQTTRYFLDGNSPTNTVGDRLNLIFQSNDGRDLNVTNQTQGNGFITFGNGNELVQFQSIESQTLGSGTGALAVGLDDGSVDDFFSTADIDDLDDIELGLL